MSQRMPARYAAQLRRQRWLNLLKRARFVFPDYQAMLEPGSVRVKKDRELTEAAFTQLLATLGPTREAAAEKYEELRLALMTFFEFRGSATAAEDTDETFNRVARRLNEGQEIFAENPASYFYAVARNIWRERLAQPNPTTSLENQDWHLSDKSLSPQELWEESEQRGLRERQLECLEQALQQLPSAERALIETYYRGTGRAKIEARQQLAQDLGIAQNALRLRAWRLRDKLEKLVNRCVKRKA